MESSTEIEQRQIDLPERPVIAIEGTDTTTELGIIHNKMKILSSKIANLARIRASLEGEIEGLRFGHDLLAEEAARLTAKPKAESMTVAEQFTIQETEFDE